MEKKKNPIVKLFGLFFLIIPALISCMSAPSRKNRIALEKFRQEDAEQRLSLWPVSYKELLIPTRFGTTYALESGKEDGPVLILIHAMGFNALAWTPNIEAWGEEFRVIALDTIGDQGKSVARRDYPKKGSEYADWIFDILTSLSIEKANVMGCSMGGWIALNTALTYPDYIDALILNSPASGIPVKTTWMKYLNGVIFSSSPEKHRKAAQFLLGDGLARRDWEDYMVQVVADTGGAKLGMPSDFKKEELEILTLPILILVGENEVIYKDTNELFEKAKSFWPTVELCLIPEAGHMGHYDNPDFVNACVLDFLKNLKD